MKNAIRDGWKKLSPSEPPIHLILLSKECIWNVFTTRPEEKQIDNKNFVREQSNGDIRRNFFSQRVVENWNNLPISVKNASNVNNFKNLYDAWKK